MKKTLLSLITALLFVHFTTGSLFAQSSHRDSIINRATAEGRKLRLDSTEWQRFKADKKNYSSDLFKPVPALVSDTSLLRDSAYAKAFRHAAYEKALHRRTAGHYILIGGAIVSVVAIIFVLRSVGTNESNNAVNALKNADL